MKRIEWTKHLLAICALSLLVDNTQVEAKVIPGGVLDRVNWQEAKGMMPDPVLHRFETGQHVSKIIALPPEAMRWSSRYNQATEENQGKYEIDDQGIMIEKATGTWPRFGYGMPFAQIDPIDPKAPYINSYISNARGDGNSEARNKFFKRSWLPATLCNSTVTA